MTVLGERCEIANVFRGRSQGPRRCADAPEVLTGALLLESSQLGAAIYLLDFTRDLLVTPSVSVLCEERDGRYARTHPA